MLGYISETWCWGSTAFDDLGGHCRGIPICKHVFFSVKTREFNLSVSNRPMIQWPSTLNNTTSENRPSQKHNHLPTIECQRQTLSVREGSTQAYVNLYRQELIEILLKYRRYESFRRTQALGTRESGWLEVLLQFLHGSKIVHRFTVFIQEEKTDIKFPASLVSLKLRFLRTQQTPLLHSFKLVDFTRRAPRSQLFDTFPPHISGFGPFSSFSDRNGFWCSVFFVYKF